MGKLEYDAKERIFDQLIIYACEKELERMDAEFSSIQASAIAGPSPEFDQKMYKLFEQEEKRLQRRSQVFFYSKIAASIVIALTVLSVAFYGADAVRVMFLNAVITVKEEYLQITFQPKQEDNVVGQGQTQLNWGNAFLPSYIPEGFSITEMEKNGSHYLTILTNTSNNSFITIHQSPVSSGLTVAVDNEGASETRLKLGNLDITIIEKQSIITGNTKRTLFWQENNCFFTISSDFDKDELLQIASSMFNMPFQE